MSTTELKPTACRVSESSSLTVGEAGHLVGQSVVAVDATEFGLLLTFASGMQLEVKGSTYGDCALSVELIQPSTAQSE